MKEEMILESLLKYGFSTTFDSMRLFHPEKRNDLIAKIPVVFSLIEFNSMFKYEWVIDPHSGRGEIRKK
jgi:hypothetical protein